MTAKTAAGGPHVAPWRIHSRSTLVSVTVHSIALLALMLVADAHPRGRGGFGLNESDSFSVTWSPGDGGGAGGGSQGQGGKVDTTVPDSEVDDPLQLSGGTEVQVEPEPDPQKVLNVVQTDLQDVFNQKTNDPIIPRTARISETGLTEPQRDPKDLSSPTPDDLDPHLRKTFAAATATDRTGLSENSMNGPKGNGLGEEGDGDGRGGGSPDGTGGQTQFFGIFTPAKRIVYVIDASESMREHHAMDLARAKLLSSLRDLTTSSQFQILFFNEANYTLNRPGEKSKLLMASAANLRLAKQFLMGIQPESGTNRFAALKQALSFEPDTIYLLTDADEPVMSAKDLREVQRANKRKASIHIVEFGEGADLSQDSFLKKLARQNNGRHHYVDLTRDER